CTPPECLDGSCGTPCNRTFCGTNQYCDGRACLETCSICPEGYLCSAGGQPPCVPQGCIGQTCPERHHCVVLNGQPVCEKNACNEDICETGQTCQNGACVDASCLGKDCGATGRCIYGACYQKCCPGLQCSDETMCLNGELYTQHCATHQCEAGFVCQAERCVPVNRQPDVQCLAQKRPESMYCDGIDSDCSHVVDDFFVEPKIAQLDGKWKMGPAAKGGYQCAICERVTEGTGVNGTRYGPRVDCGTKFFDRLMGIYLGLTAENTGQRMYNIVDWYDDEYFDTYGDLADMTSCARLELPCEMSATKIHVAFIGATQVPCNPADQCESTCRAGKLHVFRWDPSFRDWEPIGRAWAGPDIARMLRFY
ncbi:MAG: hypothetical protein ACK4N5_26065, partial [Myxococcales bacterium]